MNVKKIIAAVLVIAAVYGLWSCNKAQQIGSVSQEGAGVSTASEPRALIDEAEDRRSFEPGLLELADSEEDEIRQRLAVALGRIGGKDAVELLANLLEDSDAEVRDAAVFSAGILGDTGAYKLKPLVVAWLDKERRVQGRQILLDALGRIGDEKDVERVAAFLGDAEPGLRASVARALGFMGQRGVAVPDGVVERLADLLEDGEETVRFMCAFALYRISKPLPGPGKTLTALKKTLENDNSPEVRAYAVRALARRGGLDESVFKSALNDESDKVAATAISALMFADEARRCAFTSQALFYAAKRLESDTALIDMEFAHTARAALEAAAECPASDETEAAALQIQKASQAEARLGLAAADKVFCLARLMSGAGDVALVGCDGTRPHFGKQMLIKALKRRIAADNGISTRDFETLKEMKSESDLRVAIPAIGAIATLETKEAKGVILDSLEDDRSLIVSAALDAIAANPTAFRQGEGGNSNKAMPEVIDGVDKVVERFLPFETAYAPIISAASALGALGDPKAEPILKRMATDTRPPVRSAVLAAYGAIQGIEPPKALPDLSPVRSFGHDFLDSWRSVSSLAVIQTTRGTIEVELFDSVAPATVGSFVELANGGYFDDTEVHRVVPNFVVQGGDPTGTGYGDPGYSLRCENNSIPYERGTVGMALSGKDTGGSQFFITLSRQPHLDGNYTVFGKVTTGMDVADLIEEGDLILGISVTIE